MNLIAKIIIAIAIFLVGFYTGQQYVAKPDSNQEQPVVQEEGEKQTAVSLMFDFGNGEVKTFNDVEIKDGSSVSELLQKISTENNIELKYKDYGDELGVMVESIGGAVNNMEVNHFWQFWVNNKYAQVGANNYQLRSGDVVEWKYIRGQLN